MGTLDNRDKDLMRDAFYEALQSYGGVPGGGGGGGGGGGSRRTPPSSGASALKSIFDAFGTSLKGSAKSAVDLGVALANGGANAGEAANVLAKNFGYVSDRGTLFAKTLGKAAEAGSALINYIQSGLPAYQKLNDSGASFNNSVIGMRGAAAGMGLSLDQMSDFFQQNSKHVRQLGLTSGEAAKNFAVLSKGLIQSPIGDKLSHLGYTTGELNELLAITTMNMTERQLKEAGGTEKAIASAARLAEEMDTMAKLTGKSRKEQMKAVEEKMAEARSQAALQSEMIKGNKNAGEALAGVLGSTTGQLQSVMRDYVTTAGPLTAENRNYFATLSEETKQAINEARQAYLEGDVEAARAAAKRAQVAEAADLATNKSRADLGARGIEAFMVGYKDGGHKLGNVLQETAKAMGKDIRDPAVQEEAFRKIKEQIDKEKAARDGSTDAVIELNNRLRNAASALQDGLIGPLNKEVKDELNKFATFLRKLNAEGDQSKFKMTPVGVRDKDGKEIPDGGGRIIKGAVAGMAEPLKEGIDAIFQGNKETRPDVEFENEALLKVRDDAMKATGELIKALPEKSTDRKRIQDLQLSINPAARNSEAVVKALNDLATKENKTVDQMLKDSATTQGGLKKLFDQLEKNPNINYTLQQAAKAREQGAEVAKIKAEREAVSGIPSRTGTSSDRGREAAESLLSGVKNVTMGAVDYITVNGDIKKVGKPSDTEVTPAGTSAAAAPTTTTPEATPAAAPEATPAAAPATAEEIPVTRSTGSLGKTGKYIEDFGTKGRKAILHGREGVITEPQFNDLIQRVKLQSLQTAMTLANQSMGKDGTIDLAKFSNAINVSINSTATTKIPPISTETKNVGNIKVEEIVKAFKNIDTLNTKILNVERMPVAQVANAPTSSAPNTSDKKSNTSIDQQIRDAIQKELKQGNTNAADALNSIVSNTSGQLKNVVTEIVTTGKLSTEEGRKYYAMLSAETKNVIGQAEKAYKAGDVQLAQSSAKRAEELVKTDTALLSIITQGSIQLTEENKKYYASLNAETRAAIDDARNAYQKGDIKLTEDAVKKAQELAQSQTEFLSKLVSKEVAADKADQSIVIKYGDTLSGLAKQYGTSIEDIVKANPLIKDPNKIFAGAQLVIPGLENTVSEIQNSMLENIDDIAKGIDIRAEDGTITKGIKTNQESGDTYYTGLGNIKPTLTQSETIRAANSQMVNDLKPKTTTKQEDTSSKKENTPAPVMTKEKTNNTLDDVVRELNQLNKGVSQLLSQNEDLGRRQIRATRTVGNNNVWDNYTS